MLWMLVNFQIIQIIHINIQIIFIPDRRWPAYRASGAGCAGKFCIAIYLLSADFVHKYVSKGIKSFFLVAAVVL